MTIIAVLASWLGWLVVQVPVTASPAVSAASSSSGSGGATAFLALLCLSLFVVPLALGDSPGSGPPVLGLFNLGIAVLPRLYRRGGAEVPAVCDRPGHQPGDLLRHHHGRARWRGWCSWPPTCSHSRHRWPWRPHHTGRRSAVQPAAPPGAAQLNRRFNRTRYNAEAVVAAFTARLRQTVDLDTVQGDLVGAVRKRSSPLTSRCGSRPGPVLSRPSPGADVARGSHIMHERRW